MSELGRSGCREPPEVFRVQASPLRSEARLLCVVGDLRFRTGAIRLRDGLEGDRIAVDQPVEEGIRQDADNRETGSGVWRKLSSRFLLVRSAKTRSNPFETDLCVSKQEILANEIV